MAKQQNLIWKPLVSQKLENPSLSPCYNKQVAETRTSCACSRQFCLAEQYLEDETDGRGYSTLSACIRIIVCAASAYGFEADGLDLSATERHWLQLEQGVKGADPWIKVMKYKLSTFFAYHISELAKDDIHLELPPRPFDDDLKDLPNVLIGGRFYRWFLKLKRGGCGKCFISFLATVLIGIKKGCPRASEDGLFAAELETFEKLTKVPAYPWPVDETRERFLKALDTAIDRVVDEVFSSTRVTKKQLMKINFPSTSANYIRSRSAHGGVAEILDELAKSRFDTPLPLVREGWRRSFDEVKMEWNLEKVLMWDKEGLEDSERQQEIAFWRLLLAAEAEDNKVQTVALPEALKIRVITKGSPRRAFVLKPLQKILHSTLRKHRVFSLIGEPVTPDLIYSRIGKLLPGEKFLSGDYKDATDGLFSRFSERASHRLLYHLFADWDDDEFSLNFITIYSALFIESLTRHQIQRPTGREELCGDDEFLPQQNGQLMGSITSFPILCIVNAAICRTAIEYDQDRKVPLKKARLMVNGDDCLFPCGERGLAMWKDLCVQYGMKPSVGKFYYHSRYLNINSTSFIYNEDNLQLGKVENLAGMAVYQNTNPYEHIKFINFGLLLMKKRSGGAKGIEDIFSKYGSFAANSKDLLDSCPEQCKRSVYQCYLRRFGRFAKHHKLPKVQWFVPQKYGGIGLYPYGEWRCGEWNQRICHAIKSEKKNILTPLKDVLWTGHRTFMKSIEYEFSLESASPVKHSFAPEMTEDDRDYSRLYGHIVFKTMLEARYNRDLVYKDKESLAKSTLQYLSHNARIWHRLQCRAVLPPPLDPWKNPIPSLYPALLGCEWSNREVLEWDTVFRRDIDICHVDYDHGPTVGLGFLVSMSDNHARIEDEQF